MQFLCDFCGGQTSSACCLCRSLHELKVRLTTDGIAPCQLIELESKLICAVLLSLLLGAGHGTGGRELHRYGLAVKRVLEGDVVKLRWQQHDALSNGQSFCALEQAKLAGISNDVSCTCLRLDSALSFFQDALGCDAAKQPTNCPRQANAQSHVPAEVPVTIAVEDRGVMHGCNHGQLKGSAQHHLICNFPASLLGTIGREHGLDHAPVGSGLLERGIQVLCLPAVGHVQVLAKVASRDAATGHLQALDTKCARDE